LTDPRPTIRLDKWLYFARFFKTRSLSGKVVTGGHVRLNSVKVLKASVAVGEGDTLTFAQGDHIRVIRILSVGTRRGPAPEAQALYEDLSPPEPKTRKPLPERGGRPTKQDRRAMLRLKGKQE
jgi:ribosome-associated heat shock protein Hsp15